MASLTEDRCTSFLSQQPWPRTDLKDVQVMWSAGQDGGNLSHVSSDEAGLPCVALGGVAETD